jgi:hypothetical protein
MKIRRFILPALGFVFLMCGIAAAAVPGPQRAFAPTLYGLTEIAPNVFTDDLRQKAKWLELRERANARVENFFGQLKARPRYILCSHLECEFIFGKNGSIAQSYGWSLVHVPPKALEGDEVGIALLAHERVHSELLYRWGVSALWDQKIPNWFNEGLASFVSQDPRLATSYSIEERRWITGSKTFWDWNVFVDGRGWRTAYGAAADNVRLLHGKVGNEGLKRLIERAIAGEPFAKVVNEIAAGVI